MASASTPETAAAAHGPLKPSFSCMISNLIALLDNTETTALLPDEFSEAQLEATAETLKLHAQNLEHMHRIITDLQLTRLMKRDIFSASDLKARVQTLTKANAENIKKRKRAEAEAEALSPDLELTEADLSGVDLPLHDDPADLQVGGGGPEPERKHALAVLRRMHRDQELSSQEYDQLKQDTKDGVFAASRFDLGVGGTPAVCKGPLGGTGKCSYRTTSIWSCGMCPEDDWTCWECCFEMAVVANGMCSKALCPYYNLEGQCHRCRPTASGL